MANSMVSRTGAVSNQRSTSMFIGSAQSSDVGIQATPVSATSSQGDNHSSQQNSHTMTFSKEKSPMSLLNELARSNKINHKYVLVDESGPPHAKQFKIRLELGTEVFETTNSSIKRAQHAAADIALFRTAYPHPKPKQHIYDPLVRPQKAVVMTPTCELNTLAMKHGWSAEYKPLNSRFSRQDTRQPQLQYLSQNNPYNNKSNFHARQHWDYCNISPYSYLPIQIPQQVSFRVLLTVCDQEFQGEGETRQTARHNAASQALRALKPTLPEVTPKDEKKQRLQATKNNQPADMAAGDSTKSSTGAPSAISENDPENEEQAGQEPEISEISKVQMLITQHKLDISYEVVHESGRPHQRNFVTRCVCGEYVADGEGNSKKNSKTAAAKQMLEKLEETYKPVEREDSKARQKNLMFKKKNRNLIKMQKVTMDYGSQIHPISRLLQIQQANKKREPVFSVIEERQLPGKIRDFTVRCQCNEHTCEGRGPSKKAGKRNAAVLMLQIMGYSKPQPAPAKSVLKTNEAIQTTARNDGPVPGSNKHVTFKDTRQLESVRNLPGILVKPSPNTELSPAQQRHRDEVIASAADQLLSTGTSNICQNLAKSVSHPTSPLLGDHGKLEYLATCLNISIEYTDFPKGWNLTYCLSLVALHISKPIVAHGCGATFEESHEKAAYEALRRLQSMSAAKSYEELSRDLLKCVVSEVPGKSQPAEVVEPLNKVKTES